MPAIVLGALALFVAVGRIWVAPFSLFAARKGKAPASSLGSSGGRNTLIFGRLRPPCCFRRSQRR